MNFIKKLFGFTWGTILASLIGFVQVPIITMFIIPSEYGKAGLFKSIVMQIPILLYFGFDHAFSREYHNEEDKVLLFQKSLSFPLLLTFLVVVLSFIFSEEISVFLFTTSDYTEIVYLTGIWLVLLVIERFILLYLRMQEKSNLYSTFTFFIKLSTFVVTMILIIFGYRDFKVPIYGLLFGQGFASLVLLLNYRKLFNFNGFNINIVEIKNGISFGLPQTVSVFMITGLMTISNIFLRSYSTSYELGLFNLGLSLSSILGILRTAFNTFWLPTTYRWYKDDKSIKHYKFVSDMLLLVLSIILMMILIFNNFITLFIGQAYFETKYLIGGLCLIHLISIQSETVSLGIVFSRKTINNLYISSITILVSVILNIMLIPILGVRGAILSLMISYTIYHLIKLILSKYLGFYFMQSKQVLVIFSLLLFSTLNMFETPNVLLINLVGTVILLLVQMNTIMTAINIIFNNDGTWNFD